MVVVIVFLSQLELQADKEMAEQFSQLTLVGKVIFYQSFRLGVIKLVLKRAWWMAKDFEIDFMTHNIFFFSFKSEKGKKEGVVQMSLDYKW